MKKINLLLLIIISLFVFNINCYAKVRTYTRTENDYLVPSDVKVVDSNKNDILNTPAVSSKDKIYDFTDSLTNKQKIDLFERINKFYEKSKIDVVIVITNNLGNYGILNYAYNFYDYNDFDEDGIVFVISTAKSEPEIFMGNCGDKDDVNAKAISIYTDDRVNETLSYVYQNINDGKIYEGLKDYIKIIDGFYDIEENGGGSYKVNGTGDLIKNIPWIDISILSIALSFITVSIFIYLIKNKNKKSCNKINIGDKVDNSTLIVKCENDMPCVTNNNSVIK